VKVGQFAEGVGLPGQVTGVSIERHGTGQAGRGGRVVPRITLQNTQPVERVGLAEPVAGLARRGESALVKRGRLIPVTATSQKAAHHGGYDDRMLKVSARGGVFGGRMQVRALGIQPGRCLIEGGQAGGLGRRMAGRRASDADPGGQVPVGGQGGVQVIVQQPADRLI
jgi:hypothetical protein